MASPFPAGAMMPGGFAGMMAPPSEPDAVAPPAPTKRWEKPKLTAKEREEILKRAHERYRREVDEVDKENRDEARYDLKFAFKPGYQWIDANGRDARENERKDRICLEINQLPQFVNQVVNDMRQTRAGIELSPEGGKATEEEAKRRQGIIRGIEYESRADQVYDAGGKDAVVGGRGYWRVLIEYENARSFNRKIVIKPIADFLSVVLDSNFEEPDGADRSYGFVLQRLEKSDYERQYPSKRGFQSLDWDDPETLWSDSKDSVCLADYYERAPVERTLVRLSDDTTYFDDDPPPSLPPGIEEVERRTVDDWKVRWFKLAGGQQILDEYECPGDIIPVVCCMGNVYMIDGRYYYSGLIRFARDPQKMYNFAQSTIAETVALTPKSPYIMAEGQDEGHEDEWGMANRVNLPYLTYKPQIYKGELLPAPQRSTPAMAPPGLVDISNTSRADLRSTIGIYDPSLGQRSNETSGIAIRQREQQGDVATFNFPDNQARAIALTGRIINLWLPIVYDTERQVASMAPNGKRDTVTVNGADGNSDLNKNAQFAIRVSVGPGYETKRQEARESMMQFVQAFPPAGQVLSDMIAKQMDWEEAEEVGERLELTLPPPVQQAIAAKREQDPDKPPPDPAMLAQMQQLQGQLQQMQQGLQQLQAENQQLKAGEQSKMQAAQLDAQTKQAQAQSDAQAKAVQAQADREARIEEARINAELAAREAEIKAQADAAAAIEKARIDAATKIEVARIQAEADAQIAAMKPQPAPMAPEGSHAD